MAFSSHKILFSLFLVVGLILSNHPIFAQSDSITHHYDSLAKIKLQELDSSGNRFNNKVDSIQQRFNSFLNPDFNSLTKRLTHKNKLEVPDSLRATHDLDSMKRGITHKIDSLKSLHLPTDKFTRKLDSLNKIGPAKYIEMANRKIQSVNGDINSSVDNIENKINKPIDNVGNKINKPIDNVGNKINDKLSVLRQEGGPNANMPGNLDTKDLSAGNVNLPNANGLPNAGGLPNTELKTNINGVDNPLTKIDNPIGKQTNLKDIQNIQHLPQQELSKVTQSNALGGAKEKLGDVNQVTDKLQSYQGEVKNIASGDLSDTKNIEKTIETKAGNLGEVKDLQKQTGEMNKATGEIDKMKGIAGQANDPEALKKMAKQELQKQAVNHFKGKEEVLQQAMDKMSKLKQKYSEVTSLTDITKRPPNPMKGKPLIERIVPGITVQVQKMHNLAIDFNPVVSYRFTGRINAGLGWNERFVFTKWNRLSLPDRIYGPRVFGSFAFKKGFAAKAEVEKMNALIPASVLSTDGSRQWVWSVFVGIKKDYKFIGRVKGNVQVLYNLYDDHYNSPYADRFNVRMGFEFPMKKAKKPVK
jgi:hypothetical protein